MREHLPAESTRLRIGLRTGRGGTLFPTFGGFLPKLRPSFGREFHHHLVESVYRRVLLPVQTCIQLFRVVILLLRRCGLFCNRFGGLRLRRRRLVEHRRLTGRFSGRRTAVPALGKCLTAFLLGESEQVVERQQRLLRCDGLFGLRRGRICNTEVFGLRRGGIPYLPLFFRRPRPELGQVFFRQSGFHGLLRTLRRLLPHLVGRSMGQVVAYVEIRTEVVREHLPQLVSDSDNASRMRELHRGFSVRVGADLCVGMYHAVERSEQVVHPNAVRQLAGFDEIQLSLG